MKIKAELLQRPRTIEEEIERDVYDPRGLAVNAENDEIDTFEEAFMQGYFEADTF